MGGPEKLARRKAEGHLNARERLDCCSTRQLPRVRHVRRRHPPRGEGEDPADGKVAGFGRIDGREVAVVSNDFTVLARLLP